MIAVSLRNLSKRYGERSLYEKVNCAFPSKGLVAIVGDSGSGKSTLLDIIAGIDVDYEGSVMVLGHSLKEMSEEDRRAFRLRRIGYIRQNYDLLELENGLENVLLPLEAISEDRPDFLKRKAQCLLDSLDIGGKALQKANTLSGGEKQRVAIARSLINEAEILLCDEPTGALDGANAEKIFALLSSLAQKRLVILVSHEEKRIARHADRILRLDSGRLFEEGKRKAPDKKEGFAIPRNANLREAASVPIWTWIRHGFRLNKAKKRRTAISRFVISFSLLSLGLSLFVSRDLGAEISRVFSSLVGSGSMVMESSKGSSGPFSATPADETQVQAIARRHPTHADGYGVAYLADFEGFFPDLHEAFIPIQGHKFVIQDMGIRTAVDYLWLEDSDNAFFPERPAFMEEDEIALGLPYDTMVALCLRFSILRNYESLGEYVANHDVPLVYALENDSWGYRDEQILLVRAVTSSPRPRIYQTGHLWNAYLLETKMRFPSSLVIDDSAPWILRKIFYVHRKGSPLAFRDFVRSREDLSGYVFDVARREYAPSLFLGATTTDLKRYYVFLTDRDPLADSTVKAVVASGYFRGFVYGASGSYLAFPESLMMGFAHPFYVSSSKEAIDQVVDSRSEQSVEESALDVEMPAETVMGSYLKPAATRLTIASGSPLLSGRRPTSLLEVTLSEKLDDRLGHPDSVFAAGEIASSITSTRVSRTYGTAELKVVGISDEGGERLGVVDSWALDFFSDVLGMSSFSLLPRQAILFEKSGVDASRAIGKLGEKYPDCLFCDPSSRVSRSVSATVSYVDLALYGGMGVCLTLSFLLLLVVVVLTVAENRREGRIFFQMGLSKKDIANAFGATVLLHLASSCLIATGLLVLLEFGVDRLIKNSFSVADPFVFDFWPLGAVFLSATLSLTLLQTATSLFVFRHDFRRDGR